MEGNIIRAFFDGVREHDRLLSGEQPQAWVEGDLEVDSSAA